MNTVETLYNNQQKGDEQQQEIQGSSTLPRTKTLRIAVPRSALFSMRKVSLLQSVDTADGGEGEGEEQEGRLTDQEEQQLQYYNRLRAEFISAEQALPLKLKKKRTKEAAEDDDVSEYDVELIVKKKKVDDATNANALLVLAETAVDEQLPEQTNFDATMWTVAEQVFRTNRSEQEQAMFPHDALTILISIAREFILNTIPVGERLAYFLRRVLTSNLFGSIIQRYNPSENDILTQEEAGDCDLVIVQRPGPWFDICAFTLYPELVTTDRPFDSVRLQAKWRIEKCLQGMKWSPKTVIRENKKWKIKRVVRSTVNLE